MERVSSDRISVITLKRFKKYYIRYPSLRLPDKCDYLPVKMIQFFKTKIIKRKTVILLFVLYQCSSAVVINIMVKFFAETRKHY